MDTSTQKNLLFLLCIGALGVGCSTADTGASGGTAAGEGTTGSVGSTAPTTMGPATTLTTAGAGDTAMGTDTGVDEGPSATSTTQAGAATEGSTRGDGTGGTATGGTATDGTTTGGTVSVCDAYAQNIVDCLFAGDPTDLLFYTYVCEDYEYTYDGVSAACGSAWDELAACISLVPCLGITSLDDYLAACQSEVDAKDAACV